MNSRLVYLHSLFYQPEQEWRVFEGLMLRQHYGPDRVATIAVVDDQNAIHIIEERHYSGRNSAAFYVLHDELPIMVADIEADWEARHCWRKAYEDVQRLKGVRQ